MNRAYLLLAGLLLAVANTSSNAQTSGAAGGGDAAGPASGGADTMREDTAVFQLLLSRALGRHYGVTIPSGTSISACTGMRDAHFPPRAEGVYLKGHGIVYTVSLPTPTRSPVAADTPAADKPSEWDRALSELRGDKVTGGDSKASASREESLSASVLRALADNGKHFRGLPADEKITVAVTFRGKPFNCAGCHASGSSMRSANTPMFGQYGPGGVGTSGGFSGGGGFSGPQGGGSGGVPSGGSGSGPQEPSSDVQSKVLLGDMLVKQGKYAEAVRKYTDALNALSTAADYDKGSAKRRLQQLQTAIDIVNRSARAEVGAGNTDKAQAMLESAAKLMDRALKLAAESGKDEKPGKAVVHVPDQLIISAPKRVLDQVGAGKMSFDDFRKAANVEYFHKD